MLLEQQECSRSITECSCSSRNVPGASQNDPAAAGMLPEHHRMLLQQQECSWSITGCSCSSRNAPRAAKATEGQPCSAWGQPGASQGQPGPAMLSLQVRPGVAARGSQGRPGAARSSQGQPQPARATQELPGGSHEMCPLATEMCPLASEMCPLAKTVLNGFKVNGVIFYDVCQRLFVYSISRMRAGLAPRQKSSLFEILLSDGYLSMFSRG